MEAEVYELGDGHVHEALDRLHVAQLYLDTLVASHPLIDAVPEFHEQVQDAIERLGALYQTIGSLNSAQEIMHHHELKSAYTILSE